MKVVLYHKNCQDGLFSAYNLWKEFGGKDVLYIPVNYKPIQDLQPLEALEYIFKSYIDNPRSISGIKYSFKDDKVTLDDYKDMELYVVDYSFPVLHIKEYISFFKSILVLDHHETAINSYLKEFEHYKVCENGWKVIEPTTTCKFIFSEKESGAKLTYMYFNEGKEVPNFIELVSDRDLWNFNLKYTRAFKYGCEMFQMDTFSIIDNLMKSSLHNIIYVGEKYEVLYDNRLEKIYESNLSNISVFIEGTEYKCALINAFPDLASDLCDYAISTEEYDLALSYNIDTRLSVNCSLRSREGLDSSKLALMFGGGGHKRASGFSLTMQQFNKILDNKGIVVAL